MFYLRLAIGFITALIGMVRFKRLSMPFKILTFYLIYVFVENIANRLAIDVNNNNLIVVHLETILYFTFFSLIYYLLIRSGQLKKIMVIMIPLIFIFIIINSIYLQPYNKIFPENSMLANEIVFVILSLLLFKQMLTYPVQVNIIKQGTFWLNTAVLFFSATMFFNFAMINYYSKHHLLVVVHYFWNGSEILFNLMLGVAVLYERAEVATDLKQYAQPQAGR